MHRSLMLKLDIWKTSKRRKPLVLNGARQVGKTWLLKEFGATRFHNTAYVNFDNNSSAKSLFESDFDIERILTGIRAETGTDVEPEKTLVILDEIQECPKALTSLKYFCEAKPGLHVCAAGSLLGLTIHHGTGFPVGKVETLDLYPMSYLEFLGATGNEALADIIGSGDVEMIAAFDSKLADLLRAYIFVGGMPEAVQAYIDSGALGEARAVQQQILKDYRLDVSKHLSATEVERVLSVWDSIPRFLGRENKRFIFGQVREGSRARDYKSAITWLVQAGLAYRIERVSKPGMPLRAYSDASIFKLFMLDVGLLGAMSGLSETDVIGGSGALAEFKGALAEQYVCQQLVSECGLDPFYWSARNSSGELDFLVQDDRGTFPIEVKAEVNVRAKSLRAFHEKNPDTIPLRFSMAPYRKEAWVTNVPLYALSNKGIWG